LFTVTDQSQHPFDAGTSKEIQQCSIVCQFPALAFLDIFLAQAATLLALVDWRWFPALETSLCNTGLSYSEVCRPKGATRCTNGGEIWHAGVDLHSSMPSFTPLLQQ